MGHHPEVGQHLKKKPKSDFRVSFRVNEQICTSVRQSERESSLYHVPAYCDEGSFKEDAELCECTGGKTMFLQSSGVLQGEAEMHL